MMTTIPLFPLNTILFPGMPLNLHIFEDRYKLMINRCLDERIPFGVVLIRAGAEVGQPVETRAVGCLAEIAQMQPLPEGRMNLIAIGQERFEINAFHFDRPYLMGDVSLLDLAPAPNLSEVQKMSGRLRGYLTRYLQLLASLGQVEFNVSRLPPSPRELAYLTATLLQTPNDKKQALLELNSLEPLVSETLTLCLEETAVLKAMIAAEMPRQVGPFSLN